MQLSIVINLAQYLPLEPGETRKCMKAYIGHQIFVRIVTILLRLR